MANDVDYAKLRRRYLNDPVFSTGVNAVVDAVKNGLLTIDDYKQVVALAEIKLGDAPPDAPLVA